MRRLIIAFVAAVACGSVISMAAMPTPLYAHSPCVCANYATTFPISDACIGYTSDSVTCATIPGESTCSMAGSVYWTAYATTCAVPGASGFNGLYFDTSMSSALSFDPTQNHGWPSIWDQEACPSPAGNPGPQLYVLIGVKYYTYGANCSCPNTNPILTKTAIIGWTCDGV